MGQGFRRAAWVIIISGIVCAGCSGLALFATKKNPVVNDETFWQILIGLGAGVCLAALFFLWMAKPVFPVLIVGESGAIFIHHQPEQESPIRVDYFSRREDGLYLEKIEWLHKSGEPDSEIRAETTDIDWKSRQVNLLSKINTQFEKQDGTVYSQGGL